MKKKLLVLGIGLLCSAFALDADAAFMTYTDKDATNKDAFISATGALSNGALPNIGSAGSSETIGNLEFEVAKKMFFGTGGVTYTSVNDGTKFDDWTSQLAGPDLALSGTNENLGISIVGRKEPVYSFGFDFFEPTSGAVNVAATAVVDSIFEVAFFNGTDLLGAFEFNAPDDQAYFVGFWADEAFDRVDIRERVGGSDNEFFGEFFLGSEPLLELKASGELHSTGAPVPEPATLLLLGSGLIGLAGYGRRNKTR
jgi:hypothetical protein